MQALAVNLEQLPTVTLALVRRKYNHLAKAHTSASKHASNQDEWW
jgi:hypothetical protein